MWPYSKNQVVINDDRFINKTKNFLSNIKIEDYNELFDDLYIMYSDYINDNVLGYEIGHLSYLTDNVGSSIASRINAVNILNKIYNNKDNY